MEIIAQYCADYSAVNKKIETFKSKKQVMETMYICKHGALVIIGDTMTGNTGLGQGHRFWDYSVREAERLYRQKHGLERMRFRHKRVDYHFFSAF